MPKEGYVSITVPDVLDQKISEFISENEGLVSNKTQALLQAWQMYQNMFMQEKNPKPVRIGNKLIGPNEPIFVIAEIGINHNGSMDICKQMIDMAVEAGCDAVKFQKRTIDIVYTKEELAKPRENPFGSTNGDLKRGLEFGFEQYSEIDSYCKSKGIMWFASPWDEPSVDFLEKFNVPCYKIASASITDKKLLSKIKSIGKPIILSTGMSTIEQIRNAVNYLGQDNLIILHCTSTYPTTNLNEFDLKVINTFKKIFNCPIGYSGHEPDTFPTIMAMVLGATVIERHITLSRVMFGSDQAASLERKGTILICQRARDIPILLGSSKKKVHPSETPIISKLRRVNDL
ncbi:MAG: N-acetylneuraminate synthase family protein [archaeon]